MCECTVQYRDTRITSTYDHRFERIGHPIRCAIHKLSPITPTALTTNHSLGSTGPKIKIIAGSYGSVRLIGDTTVIHYITVSGANIDQQGVWQLLPRLISDLCRDPVFFAQLHLITSSTPQFDERISETAE